MTKVACFNWNFSSLKAGSSQEECTNSLCTKFNVNEEYKEAFRTKSYIEMWSKVQGQLRKSTSFDHPIIASPSASLHHYTHFADYLLEPRQDMLADMIGSINLHHLLVNYFEICLEACNICELLLRSIHQTHAYCRIIDRIIYLHGLLDYNSIYGELQKLALLRNPLSVITPAQFNHIHNKYKALIRRLTSKSKKIRRKVKSTKFCKRFLGIGLVITYGVLTIGLLVFAFHTMVGIAAAPALVACSLGLFKQKRTKLARQWAETDLLERLGVQLDTAAKGVYILINDFDTMSRMVRRLHDQIEHGKDIAKMCVRNNGKGEVLKEVVKEFHILEPSFMQQVEELEEHIYLSVHTINRSRSHVIQEIMLS